MTYFYDDFNRDDETPLASNDWTVLNVNLSNAYLVGTAVGSTCWQGATNHPDVFMRAGVASLAESSDNWVELIGRMPADLTVSNYATDFKAGYTLRLHWDASSSRTLSLYKIDSQSSATRKLLTSVDASTLMEKASLSDLLVIQDLRFHIESDENGSIVQLRGYLNQDDDESPSITYTDRGRTAAGDITAYYTYHDAGCAGIAFGDAANSMVCKAFELEDRAERKESFLGDSLTAQEVVDQVIEDLDQSSVSGVSRAQILRYVERGLQRVYADLGYNSFFWRRNEVLELASAPGRTGNQYICPRYVRMIEEIRTSDTTREWVGFEWLGNDRDGRMIINIPSRSGGTYEFTYYTKPGHPLAETDVIPVPRQFVEAVVQAALIHAAKADSNSSLEAACRVDYETWISLCHKEANRLRMQSRGREMLHGYRRNVHSRYVPFNQLYGFWPK